MPTCFCEVVLRDYPSSWGVCLQVIQLPTTFGIIVVAIFFRTVTGRWFVTGMCISRRDSRRVSTFDTEELVGSWMRPGKVTYRVFEQNGRPRMEGIGIPWASGRTVFLECPERSRRKGSPRTDYGTLKINYLPAYRQAGPFVLSVSKGEWLIVTQSLVGEGWGEGGIYQLRGE
jgi:hypothetical protein